MFRNFLTALAAVVLVASILPAKAQDIRCDNFIRNPDGSWTAVNNVPYPVAGRAVTIRQGSIMKPGFDILGTDVATELSKVCADAPVQTPQAELTTLTDDKGVIDMTKLTCAQLLSVYQEDADFLLAWFAGFSSAQTKESTLKVGAVKGLTHDVIVYCKANGGKKIADAVELARRKPR